MYVHWIDWITREVSQKIRKMDKQWKTRYQIFKQLWISSVSLDKYLYRLRIYNKKHLIEKKKCFTCEKIFDNTDEFFHYANKKTWRLRNICKTCRNEQKKKERWPVKSRKIYNDETLKFKTKIKRKCKRIIIWNTYRKKIKSNPELHAKVKENKKIQNKRYLKKKIIKRIEEKRAKI